MANRADLIIDQGTTFSLDIDISDSDDMPLDLNGYDIHAHIKKHYSSSKFVEFQVIKDIPNSFFTIQLADSVSLEMEPGRYYYDVIFIANSDGTTYRIIEGSLVLTPAITKKI